MKVSVIDYIMDEEEDGVRRFSFIGTIDTTNFTEIHDKFLKDIKNVSNIVLDFENLDFMNLAGVGLFLHVMLEQQDAGGSVQVENANELVVRQFADAGIDL